MPELKAKKSRLGRAASSVAGAIGKVTRRSKAKTDQESPASIPTAKEPRTAAPRKKAAAPASRAVKRESDIPLEVLDRTYTPADTSTKDSFRSDGRDHARDQDFASGVADNHWNDEDHYTNKSGDPRIGTHGRSYEPGEAAASRDPAAGGR